MSEKGNPSVILEFNRRLKIRIEMLEEQIKIERGFMDREIKELKQIIEKQHEAMEGLRDTTGKTQLVKDKPLPDHRSIAKWRTRNVR